MDRKETGGQKFNVKLQIELSPYEPSKGDFPQKMIDILNGVEKSAKNLVPQQETGLLENKKDTMFDNAWREQLDYNRNKEKQISKSSSEHSVSGKSIHLNNEDQAQKGLQNKTHLRPEVPSYPKLNNQFSPSQLLQNKDYQWGRGNAFLEGYMRPNPQNSRANYRIHYPQNYIPEVLRERIMRSKIRMPNRYAPVRPFKGVMIKPRFYGNQQYWNYVNTTLNFPPESAPGNFKPMVSHQIEAKLNEDMKRQLRDGKIVVLSDSVVKSNFNTTAENMNEKENKTDTTVSDQKKNPQIKN